MILTYTDPNTKEAIMVVASTIVRSEFSNNLLAADEKGNLMAIFPHDNLLSISIKE